MLQAGFYVTVIDAGRRGFLLGPFGSHKEAKSNVALGRKLAIEHNDRAWFYGYGTALVKRDIPNTEPAIFAGHSCSGEV